MTPHEALLALHAGLPRQGPGSDDQTRRALERLQDLAPLASRPRVLDLGCGPGRSTRVLARELMVPVEGVDLHQGFLDELAAAALADGVGFLVRTRQADMGALPDPPASVDLLWSEGAIYQLGWEEGLRRWRPLMRPGGLAAISEATWLTDAPPAGAAAFWAGQYPAMTTAAANLAAAGRAGWEVLDHFALPPAAWAEYHEPLRARLAGVDPARAADPVMAAVVEETRRELEAYERWGDAYGYVFYLLRAA